MLRARAARLRAAQAARAADRHRGRARRRADGRHLHPHRHDQQLVRRDLPDREQGQRRRRHARRRSLGSEARSQVSPITEAHARPRARGARAWPRPPARSSRRATFLDVHGKRLTTRRRAGVRRLGAAPQALRVLRRRSAGRFPRHRRRGRDRPGDGRPLGPEAGRADARRRLGARQALHDRRHREVRRRPVLRRRRRRDPDARRRPSGWWASRASYDQIDVAAQPGVTPTAAARPHPRGAARAPWTCAPARSRPPRRPRTSKATSASCAPSCSIFAYVSLFVGAFIIFNTFSITVAQRTREFGAAAHARRLARADPALGRLRRPAARRRRVAARACSAASRWRRRSTSCSRRSAPTCPTAARCSRRARSSSRCSWGRS